MVEIQAAGKLPNNFSEKASVTPQKKKEKKNYRHFEMLIYQAQIHFHPGRLNDANSGKISGPQQIDSLKVKSSFSS